MIDRNIVGFVRLRIEEDMILLSERELEVLDCSVRGLTNREASRESFIAQASSSDS